MGDKGELQVVNDPVHNTMLREEGDALHRPPALWADHRVDLENLSDHGRPALGRGASELFIDKSEGKAVKLAFRTFPRWALA
ncbi:MAG: hypothetical protein OEW18_02135 [Candidatus Aminicenantes bacterium]|nr:hypothetical protein [Candidatus Aminicenantes bacterium]